MYTYVHVYMYTHICIASTGSRASTGGVVSHVHDRGPSSGRDTSVTRDTCVTRDTSVTRDTAVTSVHDGGPSSGQGVAGDTDGDTSGPAPGARGHPYRHDRCVCVRASRCMHLQMGMHACMHACVCIFVYTDRYGYIQIHTDRAACVGTPGGM